MLESKIWDRIKFHLFYKHYYAKTFKSYGRDIRWGRDFAFFCIPHTVRVSCPQLITIGDHCQFDDGVYLQCHWQGEGIDIASGVRINAHTHILSYSKIVIEKKVLIAPFCLIASGNHGVPIGEQAIMDCPHRPSGEIVIGTGTWLGHGATILGGVSLAPQITVASRAVVTKSFVQSKIVLGGIPARQLSLSIQSSETIND